ncbi:hypothetical protein MBELCI_1617 [Limimaricola cinnabarinus LL-001]|uniref:Uncharacterized protein n=1 Tax=Limimaricola cinnabarinus LL-001 TaxID=1337093 RepID=U2Z2F4_9RHOB|nr:hypothetical protein MBELCI_1617 [Limimaricola cinnabarinus LL-001]
MDRDESGHNGQDPQVSSHHRSAPAVPVITLAGTLVNAT